MLSENSLSIVPPLLRNVMITRSSLQSWRTCCVPKFTHCECANLPEVARNLCRGVLCFFSSCNKYEGLIRAPPTWCARRPGGFLCASWSSARIGAAKITKYLTHCGLLVVKNTTATPTPQPKIPTLAHPMGDQHRMFLLLVEECNGHGR